MPKAIRAGITEATTGHSPEYLRYLATPAWARRREEALIADHYRCFRCKATENLSVHHRTYKNLGNESDLDLMVVCPPCHEHMDRMRRMATRERVWRAKGWW